MTDATGGATLVTGAGGFIGGWLVAALLRRGEQVRAVDIKPLEQWYQLHETADNRVADLRLADACNAAVDGTARIYNLACDMGGIGFIEANKADCMVSVLINTHLLMAARSAGVERYFFASSACVYPVGLQQSTGSAPLREDDASPADPEDGYGWEKLFSERMCRQFAEETGMAVRIARYHNVYGPHGAFDDGREKAPAALCRKIARIVRDGGDLEIWGDGQQTRTFLYIDDCITGTLALMDSAVEGPVNIGSVETVSIDALADKICKVAGVFPARRYQPQAAVGVRGRAADIARAGSLLGWTPAVTLDQGLAKTYRWIAEQLDCRLEAVPA